MLRPLISSGTVDEGVPSPPPMTGNWQTAIEPGQNGLQRGAIAGLHGGGIGHIAKSGVDLAGAAAMVAAAACSSSGLRPPRSDVQPAAASACARPRPRPPIAAGNNGHGPVRSRCRSSVSIGCSIWFGAREAGRRSQGRCQIPTMDNLAQKIQIWLQDRNPDATRGNQQRGLTIRRKPMQFKHVPLEFDVGCHLSSSITRR